MKLRIAPLDVVACALGGCAMGVGLSLTRETLFTLGGNELWLGVIIAAWMAGTAIGIAAGQFMRSLVRALSHAAAAFALISGAALVWARLIAGLGTHGAIVSTNRAIVFALFICAPPAVFCGIVTALLMHSATSATATATPSTSPDWRRLLGWKAIGAAGAGVAFALATMAWGHTLMIGFAASALLPITLALLWRNRVVHAVVAALLLLCAALPIDALAEQLRWTGYMVADIADDVGGRTVTLIGHGKGERARAFNGRVKTARKEPVIKDLAALCAAITADKERCLMIAEGPADLAQALEKAAFREVDVVDIGLGANTDARDFLAAHTSSYSLIVLVSDEPDMLLRARLCSRETGELAHNSLAPGGRLVVVLPRPPGIASTSSALIARTAVVHRAMRQVFAHVLALPAGDHLLVASDGAIPRTVGELAHGLTASAAASGMSARDYAEGLFGGIFADTNQELAPLETFARDLTLADAPAHTDRCPSAIACSMRAQLPYRPIPWGPMAFLVATAAPVALMKRFKRRYRLRQVPAAMALGAFAAAAVLTLLLLYQCQHALLLRDIGLLAGAFLAGCAIGAWGRRLGSGRSGVSVILSSVLLAGAIESGIQLHLLAFGLFLAICGALYMLALCSLARPQHDDLQDVCTWTFIGAAIAAAAGSILIPLAGSPFALVLVALGIVLGLAALKHDAWRSLAN